jgi:endonuclease/exonuclease/phosphatase family protein
LDFIDKLYLGQKYFPSKKKFRKKVTFPIKKELTIKKLMKNHCISWWNLENLFDTENSIERPEWLAKEIARELKGWTQEVLEMKLNQLCWVIQQINNMQGPDILGVCEVENKTVLEKLLGKLEIPGRDYKILHQDTKDSRGIDIAFIYDGNKYEQMGEIYSLELMKRNATRDIVQVQLQTQAGNELILLGNHWPSRSGGQYKSEPYRIMAGESLSYFLRRIMEIKGNDASIVVMGDFNDAPFDRSLREYALSCVGSKKVSYGKNPYLLNLMWPLLGERKATYVFNAEPLMIDQFLVTKGIIKTDGKFKLPKNPVRLEAFENMQKGRYKTPVRFSRPSAGKTFNPFGFSDHLPISLTLNESE